MKKAALRVLRLCKFRDSAVSYRNGLALQEALQQGIQDVRTVVAIPNSLDLPTHVLLSSLQGSEKDTMLCLQHTPVFTIGKRGGIHDFRQGIQEVSRRLLCMFSRACVKTVMRHLCR